MLTPTGDSWEGDRQRDITRTTCSASINPLNRRSDIMKRAVIALLAAVFPMVIVSSATAATMTYADRTTFQAQLGPFITDDYSAAGYQTGDISDGAVLDIHSNANMSIILGETDYVTTGFQNLNFILSVVDPSYCSGCNGSFELGFTTTSVGTADGVFGVGFDTPAVNNSGTYIGFVTFGDSSTANFAMPGPSDFFGITSDLLISSIHLGLIDGGVTQSGSFSIDNLTIGSQIPEPTAVLLFTAGFVVVGAATRRRAQ